MAEKMTAKEILIILIKRFEGLKLTAYLCPAGIWTNGYGSTGKDITKGVIWTKEYAEERMNKDALIYLIASKKLCPRIENEVHGAIADFAYNLGATRLAGSTLRRRINQENWEEVRRELMRWVRGGGKILPGLVRRRMAEAQLI
jgi:lysozyme